MKNYEKLRELLIDQETFPLQFTFKFIGHNSEAFVASVKTFETRYESIRHEATRESSGGKHLSKTYSFHAPDADSVIAVYRAIEQIEDLLIVL